jgi:outer membrane receptor protein involved in Fe transport
LGALVVQTPYYSLTGIPSLNPTDVKNYELDWDRPIALLHAQFRASVFYQQTANIFDVSGGYIPTLGAPYFTPTNIGDSAAHGFSLALRGTLGESWRWGWNYRFEKIGDHFSPSAQGGTLFVDYQHTAPAHLANVNLGWSRGNWEIDGYARYTSARDGLVPVPGATGTALMPLAAYVSVDGRIAYKLNQRWTIAASGQNITHAQQRQTAGPEVERQILGSVTLDF